MDKAIRMLGVLLGAVLVLLVVPGITYAVVADHPDHPLLERFAWLATIISIVVVIASILFVGQQIVDIRRSLRAAAFEATAVRIANITNQMLTYAAEYEALRIGPPKDAKAELLAETVLDAMDTELLRASVFPDRWERRLPSLEPWFKDLFTEMPGLCHVLDKRPSWYREELKSIRRAAEQ